MYNSMKRKAEQDREVGMARFVWFQVTNNNPKQTIISVGYRLPFQHNELFQLPYMAVAEISLRISLLLSSVILFFGLLSDEK